MGSVTLLRREVTRGHVLDALDQFDSEYPSTNDYDSWLDKGNYKYALTYRGRLYPCKYILSLASGFDRRDFGGGEQTNRVFRTLGFQVINRENLVPKGLGKEQKSIASYLGDYWSLVSGGAGAAIAIVAGYAMLAAWFFGYSLVAHLGLPPSVIGLKRAIEFAPAIAFALTLVPMILIGLGFSIGWLRSTYPPRRRRFEDLVLFLTAVSFLTFAYFSELPQLALDVVANITGTVFEPYAAALVWFALALLLVFAISFLGMVFATSHLDRVLAMVRNEMPAQYERLIQYEGLARVAILSMTVLTAAYWNLAIGAQYLGRWTAEAILTGRESVFFPVKAALPTTPSRTDFPRLTVISRTPIAAGPCYESLHVSFGYLLVGRTSSDLLVYLTEDTSNFYLVAPCQRASSILGIPRDSIVQMIYYPRDSLQLSDPYKSVLEAQPVPAATAPLDSR